MQEIIQHEINQQPQHYAGTPKEVDWSETQERPAAPTRQMSSPAALSSSRRSQKSKDSSTALGARKKETSSRISLESQGSQERGGTPTLEDRSYRGREEEAVSRDSPLLTSPRETMDSLKRNIEKSYCSGDPVGLETVLSREPGTGWETELHGRGFEIPAETLQSLPAHLDRRSNDENRTFQEFSGLESMGYDMHSQGARDLGRNLTLTEQRQSLDLAEMSTAQEFDDYRTRSPLSSTHSASVRSQSSPTKQDSFTRHHSNDVADLLTSRTSPEAVEMSVQKPETVSHHLPDHYTEDQLLRSFDINGLRVTIYNGDLLLEETDAIVNAANENLDHLGGVAYAISKARGKEMTAECEKYINRHGNLRTTEVMHTSGGGSIKAGQIIHAAGPLWTEGPYQEKFTAQLIQTFLNCFKYANERLWIKSMALPVLSSGMCL